MNTFIAYINRDWGQELDSYTEEEATEEVRLSFLANTAEPESIILYKAVTYMPLRRWLLDEKAAAELAKALAILSKEQAAWNALKERYV